MAYTSAYVFAPLLSVSQSSSDVGNNAPHSLVGVAKLGRRHGEFEYADSWLAAANAYPLDPENLPLSERRYRIVNVKSLFGVLVDAGPDDWGTKIQLLDHSSQPRNELERLLRLSGTGVGELRFSLSRTRPKQPPQLRDQSYLQQLASASAIVAARESLSDEQRRLLEPGSSMGGARPKTTISGGSSGSANCGARLVKFSRQNDSIDNPLVEFATMTLLAAGGIDMTRCELIGLGEYGHGFSIERFDRIPGRPQHYISAHSLFNTDRVREFADGDKDPCSYMALARILRRFSAEPVADCRQLYRRLLASVLIGNTDDHGRNHALLYDVNASAWRLSPAYDMLPIVGASRHDQQALSIGKAGRESSVENALSSCEAFALSLEQAKGELRDLLTVLDGWHSHFASAGVKPLDLQLLEAVIEPRLAAARLFLSRG